MHIVSLAAPVALLLAASLTAQQPQNTAPQQAQANTNQPERTVVAVEKMERSPAAQPSAPAALVAVRDAVTGELRAPTAAERARLQLSTDPLNRSDAGLEKVFYSDGTVGVRLDGRFQTASVVRRPANAAAQETVDEEFSCTHSAPALTQLIAAPTSAATEQEER